MQLPNYTQIDHDATVLSVMGPALPLIIFGYADGCILFDPVFAGKMYFRF